MRAAWEQLEYETKEGLDNNYLSTWAWGCFTSTRENGCLQTPAGEAGGASGAWPCRDTVLPQLCATIQWCFCLEDSPFHFGATPLPPLSHGPAALVGSKEGHPSPAVPLCGPPPLWDGKVPCWLEMCRPLCCDPPCSPHHSA